MDDESETNSIMLCALSGLLPALHVYRRLPGPMETHVIKDRVAAHFAIDNGLLSLAVFGMEFHPDGFKTEWALNFKVGATQDYLRESVASLLK